MELWCWQAQNWVNLAFQVKFDLEGQGQSPHKTPGILTKVFCIFGPNLVILAWMGHKLLYQQAQGWHMDERIHICTHIQTQPTTIPKGQNKNKKKPTDDMASQNMVTIGSVNGWAPVWHQTII